jgi:hypothetical protein
MGEPSSTSTRTAPVAADTRTSSSPSLCSTAFVTSSVVSSAATSE